MQYSTQMEAAKKGIITKEMETVAKKEHMEPSKLCALVADGQVAIPANINHKALSAEGIGTGLKTKINVNLGISGDCKDYTVEMDKVKMAIRFGCEAIMDLSNYGKTKRLGEMLHADMWDKGVPIVLTSGTLSAAGDFTHIKQGCGLDKLKPDTVMETSRPSPFDYQNNALIYISESVPFPDSKDARYIMAVADEMEQLIKAAHGHTVALFTSYRVMDFVFAELTRRGIPFPLFMMGRGRINAIEQFRQSGNGVLFATGSMWEGVDLPGDILSMLVIIKLPFSVPDPISEHQQTLYGSMAEYKNAVIIPEMLVKLMQGFGRLIRSMTDTGVVAILDSRVRVGGAYRGIVLRALPRCRVTRFIADVREFIRSKKKPPYFKGMAKHKEVSK